MEKGLILIRRYALVLVFLAIVLLGVGGYAFGYRFTGNGLIKSGTILITDVPQGTVVFADQSRLTTVTGSSARIDLAPGSHSIIVDAPGMQPWNELVEVSSDKDLLLAPVLVPVQSKVRVLSGDERAKAVTTLLEYALPTKASPLVLAGGCALVYASGNRIVADSATSTTDCITPEFLLCDASVASSTGVCPSTVVFPPNERLESVSVFPGRDDALVIAAGGQAYVVELDPREPQFFAPILRGPKVKAAPWTDSSVVISDTQKVYELSL